MPNLLLVTVTKTEAQAVLKIFSNATGSPLQRKYIGDKTYYDLGNLGGADVFMVQSEMGTGGPGGSTLTVHKAIEALLPTAVIMVGIAFGLKPKDDKHPNDQEFGHILVSKQIMAYEPQKIKGEKIIPRGDRVTCSTWLLGKFRDGDIDWPGAKVWFGLVLSGEKLVANKAFRSELLAIEPEAVGGDMEGAGLYSAASDAKTDWILVKGICDWADETKHDDFQHQAAQNAAEYVYHVIGLGGWGETDNQEPGMAKSNIQQRAGKGSTQIGQARDVNINTGPVYNILGGIHAKRDAIMHDQINYTLGDVRNRSEFVSQIHDIQARVAALRVTESLDDADEQVVRSIETRLESAAQEAQKSKPDSQKITTTLEKAKKTMDSFGDSITSAVDVGTAIAGLIQIVAKLFGG